MAEELLKRGFQKVYALKGGWKEWEAADYPIEGKLSADTVLNDMGLNRVQTSGVLRSPIIFDVA